MEIKNVEEMNKLVDAAIKAKKEEEVAKKK